MTPAGTSHPAAAVAAVAVVGVLLGGYLYAVRSARRRGRDWPRSRIVFWGAGTALIGWAYWPVQVLGPEWTFTAHMLDHLALAMAAPVFLVLSRPISLLLCALPQHGGRRISLILRSGPVAVLTHPVTAAVLSIGGVWLLYATPLFHASHEHPWLAWVIHGHFLAAGWLFTAAIVQAEPTHRPVSLALRATVLVAASAAHNILAKHLYARTDLGLASDVQSGSMLMYYFGDAAHLVLIVLVCAEWFRRAGRAPRVQGRFRPA